MTVKSLARCESGRENLEIKSTRFPTVPEQRTHVSVVRVTGGLRAPVIPALRRTVEAIIRQGTRRVLVDLNDLDDLDAAGIGELIGAFNIVTAAGGVLRIARANGYVRRLLQIAGVHTLLTGGTDA